MPFSNTVRIINFHIYMDTITKVGLTRAFDFLLKYKHPDFPLNIHIHYSKEKEVSLKYITNIFLGLPLTYLHIESYDYSEMLEFEKDLVLEHCAEVRFLKKDNFIEFDKEMVFFKSRFKDVWVIYEVDEINTKIFSFKSFYDTMGVKNTYRINYFYRYEDKRYFIKKIVEEFNSINNTNPNYLYIYEQQLPYLLGSLNNDIITHKRNTGIDIWDNKSLNSIIKKSTDISRCYNCPAIDICRGGDYTVFEQTDNSDIFCAINMAISKIKKEIIQ